MKRIEGLTKVIPILKETCEIPLSLRSLRWVDMRTDFDGGIRELEKAAYGVSDRPPLGTIPDYVEALRTSVGGLSGEATAVGTLLVRLSDVDSPSMVQVDGADIAKETSLTPQEIDDAVEELEIHGLVRTHKWMGTAPFGFGTAFPTYALYAHFSELLSYSPEQDVQAVTNAIAAIGECSAARLQEITGLSVGRLNRAVEHIDDYQLARVIKHMGTAPFSFADCYATRETRQAAKQEVPTR
jgi:hypothetical protein